MKALNYCRPKSNIRHHRIPSGEGEGGGVGGGGGWGRGGRGGVVGGGGYSNEVI